MGGEFYFGTTGENYFGIDTRELAWNTAKSAHGPWRLSASPGLTIALPNRYFTGLGLPTLETR
jgi:hypothetical protein